MSDSTRRSFSNPAEAFEYRTQWSGDCLMWTGASTSSNPDRSYGVLYVDGKSKLAHRYAWEQVHGPIPEGMMVDHVCHSRRCVNITHLRLATCKQNQENRKSARADSWTGIPGVNWNKTAKKWAARIQHNGKRYFLGYSDTPEEAGEVARLKRVELYTHNDGDRVA